MSVIKTQFYLEQLKNILRYIALDSPEKALAFERELYKKLELLKSQPEICRTSHYHQDKHYRDFVFKGYTLVFKIQNNGILLLDIFKWQER